MGFRCPKCHKDFGVDKKALEDHMYQCSSTTLNDLVEAIDTNTEEVTLTVLHSMLADMRGEE